MLSKNILGRFITLLLNIFIFICVIFLFITQIVKVEAAGAAKVNASSLNIRTEASIKSKKLATLPKGFEVNIIDEINTGKDSWYKIQFKIANQTREGFANKKYIKIINNTNAIYKEDANFEQSLNAQGFPENYKKYLRQLHTRYPAWIFKAQKTNIDWSEVIDNQSLTGRNLVHKNSISSWKSIKKDAYNPNTKTWVGFDTNAWVSASEAIIRYYMDPRNFLDEDYIFQFLDNSYTGNYNRASMENLVSGTFLSNKDNIGEAYKAKTGNISNNMEQSLTSLGNGIIGIDPPTRKNKNVSLTSPGDNNSGIKDDSKLQRNEELIGPGAFINNNINKVEDKNYNVDLSGKAYVDILLEAGKISGVNPYVLAAMIIQEQGINGSSGLISGNTAPYQGYYNYFNIEAYQKGNQSPVQRGLWWASKEGDYDRPWNSRQKAIIGGAKYYGDNYVKVSQNTLYLKKFNVLGTNRYKHQYMTNIEGAAKEGLKLSKAYTQNLKNTSLEFCIPIYNNMPENNEAMPLSNDSINIDTNNNTNANMNSNTNDNIQLIGPGANISNTNKKESNVSLVAP